MADRADASSGEDNVVELPAVRAKRIERLRSSVENGSFAVDFDRLASVLRHREQFDGAVTPSRDVDR